MSFARLRRPFGRADAIDTDAEVEQVCLRLAEQGLLFQSGRSDGVKGGVLLISEVEPAAGKRVKRRVANMAEQEGIR